MYIHGAFTESARSSSWAPAAWDRWRERIIAGFAGVVVSDRYVNYWTRTGSTSPAPACLGHFRGSTGRRQTYPDAICRCRRSGRCAAWSVPGTRLRRRACPSSSDAPDPLRDGVPARGPRRAAAGPACPARRTPQRRTQAASCSNSAATGRATCCGPRPTPRLADEQHQRARSTAHEDQQKVSGRLTSEDVTQDRLDIRSFFDAARKHGLGAMDVLHQLPCSAGPGDRPHPRSPRNHHPETVLPITRRERAECLRPVVHQPAGQRGWPSRPVIRRAQNWLISRHYPARKRSMLTASIRSDFLPERWQGYTKIAGGSRERE